MWRRSVIVPAVLLAVFATGIALLIRLGNLREARSAAEESPSPSEKPLVSKPASLSRATPLPQTSPRSTQNENASARSSALNVPEGAENDPELRDALWVEGRVVIPEGTPVEEHVEIVADGHAFEKRPLYRSTLGPDGSFRVAFARPTFTGLLRLEARYLYLEHGRAIEPIRPPKNLVLEPKLGGVLRGRLFLSPGTLASRDSLVGCSVSASGELGERTSKISSDLGFEFLGLPACSCFVRVDTRVVTPPSRDHVVVEPGRTVALELEVLEGGMLRGRVVDDKAVPLEGASVSVRSLRSSLSNHVSIMTDTRTDGTFAFTGLPKVPLTLNVRASRFIDAEVEVGEIADGEAKDGIEIALSRALPVSGRVVWPDGAPVSACKIRYSYFQKQGRGFSSAGNVIRSDDDGRFEITDLGQSAISITASGSPSTKPGASGASARSVRRVGRPDTCLAHIDGVNPGTEGLVLTLREGASIRGQVVSESGEPIASCSVEALPIGFTGEQGISASCDKADGTFDLVGLYDGDWSVTAQATGYARTTLPKITIPGQTSPLVVTMRRPATLSGIVLDELGRPVSDAMISVGARVVAERLRREYGIRFSSSSRSDSDGLFRINDVEPGAVVLSASARGWKGSQRVELDLQSGQEVTGLRLTLGPAVEVSKDK
jgi:protocatechuate 3,4-dioxygenase beta subunit